MRSFGNGAWTTARRRDSTEPLRYTAQRFGELLDPHAHFAASASFALDPVTAVGDFIDLARAHKASNGRNPSFGAMVDAVERTRTAVTDDPNCATWYGRRRDDALRALNGAIDWNAAQAANVGKKRWLGMEAEAAGRGAVRLLRASLVDPANGYRRRLVDAICGTCLRPSLPDEVWRSFDTELRMLAALLLAEGRTEVRVADDVISAIRAAGGPTDAVARLKAALDAPMQGFQVAFPIEAVKHPRRLKPFGCRDVRQAEAWDPLDPRPQADDQLRRFVAAREPMPTVVAEVEAFDFDHAVGVAWQVGERLADQYGAEHRAYPIKVPGPLLVLREADSAISEHPKKVRPVYVAQPRLRRPDARWEQSLRYAALARSERSPVVQVLHSWIALETLAAGRGAPMGPYQLLMNWLAPALAVHAVRQGLATTWHIASRNGRRSTDVPRWDEVEAWLGVRGRGRTLPDLNRWVDLMREPPPSTKPPALLDPNASVQVAASLLAVQVPRFEPFAREAVLRWRWRLAKGSRLSNWCDVVERQTRAILGRMYVIRNSTVHTALTQAMGGDQLAHAAGNVVDAVYEVLPPWLPANRPIWTAFERLHRRATHLHRTWTHLSRPALLNAQLLTRPGGDGLSR